MYSETLPPSGGKGFAVGQLKLPGLFFDWICTT